MASISLCMIAKNEEGVLARALDCAARFADEIVVVDTGSHDQTRAIAARYTDKVYDFEWCDDFSAARNYAFEQASGDYLMWLDADDLVDEENIGKLVALKQTIDPAVDVVMMRYQTGFDEAGRVTFSFLRERLIRRASGLRWREPVHEYIPPLGKVIESEIAIQHRPADGRPYSTRNLDIYEKQLLLGKPLSTRGLYYYARELKNHGRFAEAVARFDEYLARPDRWVEDAINACADRADCLFALGESARALASLTESFVHDLPRAEILCRLGLHFQKAGDPKRAVFWYELVFALPKPSGWGFTLPDQWDFVPHLQLCVLYDKLGNREQALAHHEAARRLKPDHPSVLHNQAYFCGE